MRSLSIQIQPERSPGINIVRLTKAFESIASDKALVENQDFNSGEDGGAYFNYTFGTRNARLLWDSIRNFIYLSPEFGQHMKVASMAVCSEETGWDNYLLLFHYDPALPLDSADTL